MSATLKPEDERAIRTAWRRIGEFLEEMGTPGLTGSDLEGIERDIEVERTRILQAVSRSLALPNGGQ